MSSSRKRHVLEESDQENEARSSAQLNKRARRGSVDAEAPSGSATPEASMDEEQLERSNSTNQTSFHEEDEDEENDDLDAVLVDDEEEEEDEEDEEENLAVEEQYAADMDELSKQPGSIADMGIIERVEVYNFMCHEAFSIDLGPQVNFVIGHNGSGKSAILTAITVALGGKATSTGRGNGLKSLVRAGTQTAEIVVHLKNEGEEAFKPEKYGNKIIIVRRINADGGGSWKLKSVQDKIVSTKKEELDAIADKCNIQADNPMSILNQDAARSFLASSGAGEKYDFFLRGTQLQQLTDEYDTVRTAIKKVKVLLVKKEEGIPVLRVKAIQLLDEWKAAHQVKHQSENISRLKLESVWAQVTEREKMSASAESKALKAEKKVEAAAAQLATATACVEAAERAMEEIENRHRERVDNVEPLKEQLAETQSKIRVHKEKIKAMFEEERSINQNINEVDEGIKSCDQQIREANFKVQRNAEMAEKRRLDEDRREELRKECDALAHQKRDLQEEEQREQARSGELYRTVHSAEAERDGARTHVQKLDQTLNHLRASRSDKLAAYGPNVPRLLQAMQTTRWQGTQPLGPLGRYCKLKAGQNEWAAIIEAVLGKTLNAFLVSNRNDQRTLQNLMKQYSVDSTIILQQDDLFDYSHGEPANNIRTILRVLDFTNESVLRVLINTSKIECTALVPTRADGDQLMSANYDNIKLCYSGKDMYKITGGRHEAKSSTTVNAWSGPFRMTASTAGQEQDIGQKLQEAEARLLQLNSAVTTAQNVVTEWTRNTKRLKNNLTAAASNLARKEREILDLDVDLHEEIPEVEAYETHRKELEIEHSRLVEKFQSVQTARSEVAQVLSPLVRETEEINRQISDLQFEDTAKTDELQVAHLARTQATTDVKHYEKKVLEATMQYETLRCDADEERANVEQFVADALEFSDGVRLRPIESSTHLQKKIALIEKKVAAFHRSNQIVDIDELDRNAQAAKMSWQGAGEEIKSFKRFLRSLHEALKLRLLKWRTFRRFIALRARGIFSYYLSKRGYSGSLKFNHNTNQLGLTVRTEENGHEEEMDEEDREKAANTLSGGEKSFSTICLLLSLWAAINSPVRCLDEFDVFMDAVNRKIAMKMIIEAAKAAQGVQFMLITPLNMPAGMSVGREVRITKLSDPNRVAV